jgi:guanylate kinase
MANLLTFLPKVNLVRLGTYAYSTHMELDDRLRQKVAAYKPSPDALKPIRRAPLLLLVGISGAGKDAVIEHLRANYPNEYAPIVSHVTRPPRPYEKEGVHYHFIDFTAAEKMLDTKGYIESDVYAENIYGTSIAEVERIYKDGKIGTTDITIRGADNYIGLGLNAKAVFLLPPSYDIWRQRYDRRADNIQTIDRRRRLRTALREIKHALEVPHYYIVINDKLEDTAELVNRIAHNEPVEPHYHKAVEIAEEMIERINTELGTLDA